MAAAASKQTNTASQEIAALRAYVVEMEQGKRKQRVENSSGIRDNVDANNLTVTDRIKNMVEKQPPLTEERVVYRGQHHNRMPVNPTYWISTSSVRKVAIDMFSKMATDMCCIFEIHLQPGIRILDINAVLGERGRPEEHEIIIQGGGGFYQDAAGTIPGFKQIDEGVYETFYFPRPAVLPIAVAPLPSLNDAKKRDFLQSVYNSEVADFDFVYNGSNAKLNEFYSGLTAQTRFEKLGISKNNVKRFLNTRRRRHSRRSCRTRRNART